MRAPDIALHQLLTVMATSAVTFAPPERARCAFAHCPAPPNSWKSIRPRSHPPPRRRYGRLTRQRGDRFAISIRYYESAAYKALDGSTRNWQRRALDEIAREHGAKQVATMQARHVRRLRDAKAATPAAANQRVKGAARAALLGNEAEKTSVNPTIGVKKLKYRSDGHHTWTDEEIQKFYDQHPLGSQARLALDLLRYTTGRREDGPRLGRQHIRDGRIRFRQAKNEHRNPIDIDVPLHPALAESIAAANVCTNMTFLLTEFGKPFTANGFGNKFKDWCRQADLPHCSAHGV